VDLPEPEGPTRTTSAGSGSGNYVEGFGRRTGSLAPGTERGFAAGCLAEGRGAAMLRATWAGEGGAATGSWGSTTAGSPAFDGANVSGVDGLVLRDRRGRRVATRPATPKRIGRTVETAVDRDRVTKEIAAMGRVNHAGEAVRTTLS